MSLPSDQETREGAPSSSEKYCQDEFQKITHSMEKGFKNMNMGNNGSAKISTATPTTATTNSVPKGKSKKGKQKQRRDAGKNKETLIQDGEFLFH